MTSAGDIQIAATLASKGFDLLEIGRLTEATTSFTAAIAANPENPDAHFGLSWALLARGDYERGWKENEWRTKCKMLVKVHRFPKPLWDGSDLYGKTILLHQEQGLGDVIYFVRYAPMVAERGGRVLLGCHPHLGRLLQHTPGVAEIAPSETDLPPFDVHLSLHSLPRVFGTTSATIPAKVPYVFPDAAILQRWRVRVSPAQGILHVGIAWAGNAKHLNDRLRSIDPALLVLLTNIPGVQFYSLQKDMTIEQARRLPAGLKAIDWALDLKDWNDTAAAMKNLDLIISVDTSIAHMAGALARPTWTLLTHHADWRWLVARDDSPWYPTMRLFRQTTRSDWPTLC